MMLGTRSRETWLQTLLLVLAAGAASLVVAQSLWETSELSPISSYMDRMQACMEGLGGPVVDSAEAQSCFAIARRPMIVWQVAVTAAVLALAVMAAAGSSLLRRRGLRPLPQLPGFHARVVEPVLFKAGLPSSTVVTRPQRPTAMARADGIVQRYVEVGPNWIALGLRSPDRARAILAHECAHHAAYDVGPARLSWWLGPSIGALTLWYLAEALRTSSSTVDSSAAIRDRLNADYAGSGLLEQYVDVFGIPDPVAYTFLDALPVALVLVVVLVGRAGVLRAREYAADASAAKVHGLALVDGLHVAGPLRERAVRLRPFATHPAADDRRSMLLDPSRLARVRWTDAVVTGLMVGVAGPVLTRAARTVAVSSPRAASWLGSYASFISWGLLGAVLGAWCAIVVARAVNASPEGAAPGVGSFAVSLALATTSGSSVLGASLGVQFALPDTVEEVTGWALFAACIVAMVGWTYSVTCLTPRSPGKGTLPLIVAASTACGALTLGIFSDTLPSNWSDYGSTDGTSFLINVLNVNATDPRSTLLIGVIVFVPALVSLQARQRRHFRDLLPLGLTIGLTCGVFRAMLRGFRGPYDELPNWYAVHISTLTTTPGTALVLAFSAAAVASIRCCPPSPLRALGVSCVAVITQSATTTGIGLLAGYGPPNAWLERHQFHYAVVGTYLLAASARFGVPKSLGGRVQPRVAVSVAAAFAAVVMAGVAAWGWSATPTVEADRAHLTSLMRGVNARSTDLSLSGCLGTGAADGSALTAARRLELDLQKPDDRSGTAAGADAHRQLTELMTDCRMVLTSAVATQRPPSETDVERLVGRLARLKQSLEVP